MKPSKPHPQPRDSETTNKEPKLSKGRDGTWTTTARGRSTMSVLPKSLAAAWGMRGGFPVCQHAAYMFGCKGVVRQMQPYVLNDTALVTIPKAVSQQQLQHAA